MKKEFAINVEFPDVWSFSTNANCPPYTNAEEMRQIMDEYTWGVAVKLDVEPSIQDGERSCEAQATVMLYLRKAKGPFL